jgi:flagellar assembly protein FliH
MSWSDIPPKVLKNVRSFSRVRFDTFEALPEVATEDALKSPEANFDSLADAPDAKAEFLSITDHPDLTPSEPGPASRENCSEALEIVRQTEEEMAALKEETCRQCTLLEQEAYDKGFSTGEKEGIRAGEKKIQTLAADLTAAIDSLAGLRSDLVARYEAELLDLVLAICKKIIYCEVSLDSRVIQETVRQIIDDAPGGQPITLRLHPEDMEAIDRLKSRHAVSVTDMNRVSLVADTSVSRGGCRLETPHGNMDATIETRFNHVYEVLKHAGGEPVEES